MTLHSPRQELPQLGYPKRFFEENLSRLPELPYRPRRDNWSCFSPRDGFAILIGRRLVEFCKEISLKLLRVLIKLY